MGFEIGMKSPLADIMFEVFSLGAKRSDTTIGKGIVYVANDSLTVGVSTLSLGLVIGAHVSATEDHRTPAPWAKDSS